MRSWNSDLDLMNKEISKLYKSVSEMSIGDKYRESKEVYNLATKHVDYLISAVRITVCLYCTDSQD